jgi:LysR family transcriptional regulator, transcriptional activator of nhaA
VEFLNYHHLRYFWVVAQEGSLRKASEKLHVSQPTISEQIVALESAVGDKLFHRSPRGLLLTDTGRLAFSYAEEIFSLGQDFLHSLKQGPAARPLRVNIGIADSLPKLISHEIVRPIFRLEQPVHALFTEGKTSDLLGQLAVYRVDMVLADEPAPGSLPIKAFNHLLGKTGVSFCAEASLAGRLRSGFPRCLDDKPMLLPAPGTVLRRTLDKWFLDHRIRPRVIAEYEDAGLMKVAAADGLGCFPLPTRAVAETISRYGFKVIGEAEDCAAHYYAITAERRLTHPAVMAVTSNARGTLFGGSR